MTLLSAVSKSSRLWTLFLLAFLSGLAVSRHAGALGLRRIGGS
jgi:hypothetical protein